MPRWRYCAVELTNTKIYVVEYTPDGVRRSDGHPTRGDDDLGRALYQLGQEGWELVSVFRSDTLSEWHFKRRDEGA